jgi:small-conductance mechanosensitive channel
MMIQSLKSARFILLLTVPLLLLSALASCGGSEPASAPQPSVTPSARTTDTPAPPSATPEPQSDEEEADETLVLPTATLAPTATPDVVTELIRQVSRNLGVQDVIVLTISAQDWIDLGVSLLLVFIFGSLLSRLVYFLLTRTFARAKNKYAELFIKQIRRQITLIILVLGFHIGISRLPFIDALVKLWLRQLYIAIVVVAVTIILWRLMDILVEWYQTDVEPQRDRQQVDTILLLLHRAGRTVLVMISAITLLSLYNVNVNALIAALGVGGLALSLAAQDTLSNVISGIMIMLDRPFRVGDRIEVKGLGTWGDVVDIGLRSTRIRTRDNRLVIVPNNTISTDQIVNYTYPDPRYRIQIEIGIAYGQDIEKVRKVLVDTVSKVEGVLPDKPVDALYERMGDSAMTFRVRWWIDSYVDTRRMFDRVNTALQVALDREGIASPFNTFDINILNMPGIRYEKPQPPDEDSQRKGPVEA